MYAVCRPWRSPGGTAQGRQGQLGREGGLLRGLPRGGARPGPLPFSARVPGPRKGLRAGFWAWVVGFKLSQAPGGDWDLLVTPLTALPRGSVQTRHGGTPSGCCPGAHHVPQCPPCGVSVGTGLSGRAVGEWAAATWVQRRPRGGGRGPRCCCPPLQEADEAWDALVPSLACAAAYVGDLEALQVLVELVSLSSTLGDQPGHTGPRGGLDLPSRGLLPLLQSTGPRGSAGMSLPRGLSSVGDGPLCPPRAVAGAWRTSVAKPHCMRPPGLARLGLSPCCCREGWT